MKPLLVTILSFASLTFAAETPPVKTAPPIAREFIAPTDDPQLPRVLIIGDSVSVAYTLGVRKNLAGVANVHRIPANGGSTRTALGDYGLVRWLKPGEKWDVIHFNEGLHDLSYRFPDDRDKNDEGEYASPANGARPNVPLVQYEKNLRLIVARLKQTGAKLIFASTTPVPEANAAKYVKDSELPYNDVAKKVMADEGVTWNDLWAAVKPRQAELQGKRDVHFMPSGSAFLAQHVAAAIARELPAPTKK